MGARLDRELLADSSQRGRWSLLPPFTHKIEADAQVEKWAWLLLKRYGVVFRDLMERESLAPAWHDVVRVYRRLEMRGEIRGGRFVSQVAGEQFRCRRRLSNFENYAINHKSTNGQLFRRSTR